jgi:hypothetical protein
MKKIWVFLLVLTMFSVPGCQPSDASLRPEVLAYLKSANAILQDLPQIGDFPAISNDLGAINRAQTKTVLTQNIAKYQAGLQLDNTETVPDISEVEACHQTGLSLIQQGFNTLQKMLSALDSGNKAEYAQAVDQLNSMRSEVPRYYRQIEDLMSKYNIADSEVGYQFRGK